VRASPVVQGRSRLGAQPQVAAHTGHIMFGVVLAISSTRPQTSYPCSITGHDRCGVLGSASRSPAEIRGRREAAAVARSFWRADEPNGQHRSAPGGVWGSRGAQSARSAARRTRRTPPPGWMESRPLLIQSCTVLSTCAGWLAHPWLKARDRAVDTAPGHRTSARCDSAASLGWSWRL